MHLSGFSVTVSRTMARWHPDRWLSLFVVRPLQRAGLLKIKPGIPVLMYHSVSDDPERGVSPYYRLSIPPVQFERQMRWLRAAGYSVIGLDEAVRLLRAETPELTRKVVLTFDDGFRDFRSDAWPVLQELGFPATVFVATGWVGKSFLERECLSWSEIRELQESGVTFGSHTVHHARLVGLECGQVEMELADSKRELEDQLGVPVPDFCYPYAYPEADAAFCLQFSERLSAVGYRSCATTRIGRAAPGDDLLALRRLPINGADDLKLMAAKLEGAYDWLAVGQHMAKRWKHR